MNVITGDRQSGKTTEAIKLANEEDAYLAVHTKQRATQLYHSDKHPDLDKFPITYAELRDGRSRGRQIEVVIDDLDMFLHSEFDVPITGVSMTASDTTNLSDSD